VTTACIFDDRDKAEKAGFLLRYSYRNADSGSGGKGKKKRKKDRTQHGPIRVLDMV